MGDLSKSEIFEMVERKKISAKEALVLIKNIKNNSNQNIVLYSAEEPIVKSHVVFGERVLVGGIHLDVAIRAVDSKKLVGLKRVSFNDAIGLKPLEKVQLMSEISEKSFRILYKILKSKEFKNFY